MRHCLLEKIGMIGEIVKSSYSVTTMTGF